MNPVEEFLAYEGGVEKTAAPMSWAARHPMATQAAFAVGVPLAGMAAYEGYQEVKGMIGRARGYKKMLEHNPGLKKLPATQTKAMFNTLHNAAPDLARDPVVASSWVQRMHDKDDYVDPRTLADLGSAQQKVHRPGLEFPLGQVTTGMMGAAKDVYMDPRSKQLDRSQRAAEQAQNLAHKEREYELSKAQSGARDARDAAKAARDAAKHQGEMGAIEAMRHAGVGRADAAARADRARARWYNKKSSE